MKKYFEANQNMYGEFIQHVVHELLNRTPNHHILC